VVAADLPCLTSKQYSNWIPAIGVSMWCTSGRRLLQMQQLLLQLPVYETSNIGWSFWLLPSLQ